MLVELGEWHAKLASGSTNGRAGNDSAAQAIIAHTTPDSERGSRIAGGSGGAARLVGLVDLQRRMANQGFVHCDGLLTAVYCVPLRHA